MAWHMYLYKRLRPVAQVWANSRMARNWRGLRFLCYHSIISSNRLEPTTPSTTITKLQFRNHLEWFRNSGFTVVSMNNALELLETGRAGEGKFLCLSFDDGSVDHYTVVWPILKEFGFPAHFFIVSQFIGRVISSDANGKNLIREYMTEKELKEIIKQGGSIGSHSATHLDLTKLNANIVFRELQESKHEIELVINQPVTTFAYPYAAYNRIVIESVMKAGYHYAFRINFGTVKLLSPNNRYSLPRTVITGALNDWGNYLSMKGGYDWAKYYSNFKRRIKQLAFR